MPVYTYTTLDDPSGNIGDTFAQGINDTDQIVGWYIDKDGRTHGYISMPTAAPTPPSTIPSASAVPSQVASTTAAWSSGVTPRAFLAAITVFMTAITPTLDDR